MLLPILQDERMNDQEALIEDLSFEALVTLKLHSFIERLPFEGEDDLHEMIVSKVERALIRLVLDKLGGNRTRTAQVLGLSRGTLAKRIKDLKVLDNTRRPGRKT
ncbi:MAG: hypothetical protein A2284_06120 [Deltaproteobacteria bacterium RIFOXYA12_FULL_61_11]|nr:MAG: hypothetical protein A2284_06120 [Deltaproteobacteria bacterium RIFOXYA12_FULL_61_11]